MHLYTFNNLILSSTLVSALNEQARSGLLCFQGAHHVTPSFIHLVCGYWHQQLVSMLSWAKTAQAQSHLPYYESRAYPTAHAAPMAYQSIATTQRKFDYAPHNRFGIGRLVTRAKRVRASRAIWVDFRLAGLHYFEISITLPEHHYVDSYCGRPAPSASTTGTKRLRVRGLAKSDGDIQDTTPTP